MDESRAIRQNFESAASVAFRSGNVDHRRALNQKGESLHMQAHVHTSSLKDNRQNSV